MDDAGLSKAWAVWSRTVWDFTTFSTPEDVLSGKKVVICVVHGSETGIRDSNKTGCCILQFLYGAGGLVAMTIVMLLQWQRLLRWRGALHLICRCYAQRRSDTDNGINFLWFLEQRARWEIIEELNELGLNIIRRLPKAIWLQIAALPVELGKRRQTLLSLFAVIPYKLTFTSWRQCQGGLLHLFGNIWKDIEEQIVMNGRFVCLFSFFSLFVLLCWLEKEEAGFYPQDNEPKHLRTMC